MNSPGPAAQPSRAFWPAFLSTLCIISGMPSGASAEPKLQQTLTSASRNLHVQEWTSPGGPAAGWSVSKTVLHGGKQEGVELIRVNNGKLTIVICPTRGMGVMHAQLGNVELGWRSPVKEIVNPAFINLQSRGGLGWLEGFNEMIARCGLEFAGHPGKDKFVNNTGDEAEMDLTLHGKIANIPASEVEVIVEADGLIRVRGKVEERMFYGPKLDLWTEISTRPNSDTFTLHDKITNQSAYEQEFQLIYHSNFGPSVLESGSRFSAPVARVAPFNENAAKAVKTWTQYSGPTPGFIEQVYCLFPLADSDGHTTILLQNAAGDQGISMTYSIRELPFLTLWKNTPPMEEGYVTGLEPGTGFPLNRRFERKAGRVPKLKPAEQREFTINYQVHTSKAAVDATRDKIVKIRGSRPTQVDTNPLPRQE